MTLTNKAVLVIEDQERAAFEFTEFDNRSDLSKNFLVGGRGELIAELADVVPSIDSADSAGYIIDVGLGTEKWELTVTIGAGDSGLWGTVDASNNPISGTKPSAHNSDQPITRADVLKHRVRTTAIDSLDKTGTATLHIGEHSDGTFGSSGKLSPVPVAPEAVDVRRRTDEPSTAEIDVTVVRTEAFPTKGGVVP